MAIAAREVREAKGKGGWEKPLNWAKEYWESKLEEVKREKEEKGYTDGFVEAIEAISEFYKKLTPEKIEAESAIILLPENLLNTLDFAEALEVIKRLGLPVEGGGGITVNLSDKKRDAVEAILRERLEREGKLPPLIIVPPHRESFIDLGEVEALELSREILDFMEEMVKRARREELWKLPVFNALGIAFPATGVSLMKVFHDNPLTPVVAGILVGLGVLAAKGAGRMEVKQVEAEKVAQSWLKSIGETRKMVERWLREKTLGEYGKLHD